MYTLVNGKLFANASTGTTQFGTNSGVDYAVFTPKVDPGPINTAFSVDSQNNLMWNNVAFYNNMASWCILPNNSVVAVFGAPSVAPEDCIFVQLSLVRRECWPDLDFRHANDTVSYCVADVVGPSVRVYTGR